MYQLPVDSVSSEIQGRLLQNSLNQSDHCFSSSMDIQYNLDSSDQSQQRTEEQQLLCCFSGVQYEGNI